MSHSVFLKPDENGNWGKVGSDATGNVSQQLVFQDAATALGDGTVVDVSGYTTLSVQFTFTGTATILFETSLDGITYTQIIGRASSSSQTAATISANATYIFSVAGVKYIRMRISAYTSGTVTAVGYASTGSNYYFNETATYGNSDTNLATIRMPAFGAYNLLFDGANWVRQRMITGDGGSANGVAGTVLIGFNGTNWDRIRNVPTVDGVAGTGIQAHGRMLYNATGVTWERERGAGTNTDGASGNFFAGAGQFGFAGATFDRVRVGKVYKYIEYLNLANATAITVWTPASTKKFRLMGVSISVSGTNAAVHLRDGAGGTIFHTVRAPGTDTKTFDFGNGYLSSAVNNVLEIYNLTGGTINVQVTAWGTEE